MGNHYTGNSDILHSFESYLAEKGRSVNTVKTYSNVLQSFFNWLGNKGNLPNEFRKQDVQLYINHLEKEQRSFSTLKKVYNTINTFAKFINRTDITQDIQFLETETEQNYPEFLSKEEIEKLLYNVEEDGSKRNTAITHMLLKTGIRVSELCSLNKTHIELNDKTQTGQVVVRNKLLDNTRTIPLQRSLYHHLTVYIDSRNDNEEALFISNYQQRISSRTVQHMLKQYGVYPHKLRHTYCYGLIGKGLDLSIVAQLAGHSDIYVTKQYLKLRSDLEDESNKKSG